MSRASAAAPPSTANAASTDHRRRIAAPGMLLEAELLPHLICSRPMFIGGVKDEADQHGGAGRVGGSDSGAVYAGGQDGAGPYPRRVHGDYRLSPQACDAAASRRSIRPAFWPKAWAPDLRRGYAGSPDHDLGGIGPDLRQAATAPGARSGGGDGAARPSSARSRGAHQSAGDERGHDRPGPARGQTASGSIGASQ